MTWRPIATAPTDGRLLDLRREVGDRVIHEGPGLYGRLSRQLPGLNQALRYWLRPDRSALWGGPTHWRAP